MLTMTNINHIPFHCNQILSKILNVITAEKTNEKRESSVLLIGMYIGIDLVTNTYDVSQKSKKRTLMQLYYCRVYTQRK